MQRTSIQQYAAVRQGRLRSESGYGMEDSEASAYITGNLTELLHYADSLGLDPIALSRMAEMHYIDERAEGGEG